jgi:hypothetical protein
LIPANALALCGRRIYNRRKILADLVEAGLLVESPSNPGSYLFPISWHKYQKSDVESNIETAGQGMRSHVGGRASEEKRREEKRSSIEDRNTTGPVKMNLDGMMHELRNGQWEQVNGSAPSTQ